MIEIIIVLLLLISGNDFQRTEAPEKVIVKANNEFSFNIWKALPKLLEKNENDVISPISIMSAFSILMNGANGQSLADMKRFLGFENAVIADQSINQGFLNITQHYQNKGIEKSQFDKLFKHKLNLINRFIHNKKIVILPGFKNSVKEYFKGEVQSADFENNAVEETNKINEWVRNQTNNKIQKIFDKLEEDTTAVIVNVLYFKGIWSKTFPVTQTKRMDFYNSGVTAFQIDSMNTKDKFNYVDSPELDSQVLEMDYLGGDLSFVVVLPKQRTGLNYLYSKMNAQNIEKVLQSMAIKNVNVTLPKFKVEKSYDLMKEMDPKPIALTKNADLSRMTSQKTIISNIVHKVFIEVNEKGTEAAAVTALQAVPVSLFLPLETIDFRADHPFVYFIRDKTNSMILFTGQINKF